MLDDNPVDQAEDGSNAEGNSAGQTSEETSTKPVVTTRTRGSRTRARKAPAAESPQTQPEAPSDPTAAEPAAVAEEAPAKPARKRAPRKKAAAVETAAEESTPEATGAEDGEAAVEPAAVAEEAPAKPARKRAPRKKAAAAESAAAEPTGDEVAPLSGEAEAPSNDDTTTGETQDAGSGDDGEADDDAKDDSADDGQGSSGRRRRRRGGRRRRRSADGSGDDSSDESDSGSEDADSSDDGQDKADGDGDSAEGTGSSPSSRRRRRRRRAGEDSADSGDDPENTVVRVRRSRSPEDQITAVTGSTRLEAKKQRRREGREAGRRRAPIVSEAEFLARRESVERVMVIREREDLTQIAVLEDKVLVEHYVARESQTSLIGNVYVGRVQNVLPSMEAAFIDIGKGRNAVLYAGEVNWSALGHKDGEPRKIESVLQSGQTVLVQVTKDPIGHKGARLTSQISLAGRFLVYVPDGTTNGISRKLPDTERNRLKTLLKEIVPDGAGVIVRTAAEGASEEELTRDVERLKARWADIEKKSGGKGGGAQLLYGEPDLTLKVVRDLFTEDFTRLVIEGDEVWDTVHAYVDHMAPDLVDRLERFERADADKPDVFASYRIDEQIHKALDRKVWLPSGGSLIIDRTEAMTVVDVNTGKFTGSGGNLEETVTKNNLEAAEEIVRQLRLRDIGGIIVIDFIDMVLESNRDLVLRRLVECLGRDRTRHQVAEVTSLGLVQMTRKRIGTGLLEAFSENCSHCQGRGVLVADAPIEPKGGGSDDGRQSSRRSRGGRSGNGAGNTGGRGSRSGGNDKSASTTESRPPSPADVAAMARTESAASTEEAPQAAETDAAETGVAETTGDAATPVESGGATESPVAVEPSPSGPDAEVQADAEPPTETAVTAETAEPAATPAGADPTPEAPEAPRVVTRTRRRAASRPAGPPSGGDEAAATDTPETSDEAGTSTLHVPVKKRGSRKR